MAWAKFGAYHLAVIVQIFVCIDVSACGVVQTQKKREGKNTYVWFNYKSQNIFRIESAVIVCAKPKVFCWVLER